MIHIEGDFLEGGGQILRTSLALSTFLQKPVEIINIRKNRPEPGLKNQHLYCIRAFQQLCNAKVDGDHLGSERLLFIPDKISSSTIKIDIETAGSITLLLQSLLLPVIFSGKNIKIEVIGGTDVNWSPQIDYFKEVIIPSLIQYAEKIELNIERRGYYPKGNGKVILKIRSKYNKETIDQAPKFDLVNYGNLLQIRGISHASTDLQKAEVAERQANAAKLELNKLKVPIKIDLQYQETLSTGSGITLIAFLSRETELIYKDSIRIGSDILGEKGKPAENIGKQAAEKLLQEINSKSPVDQHLADNLIPFLAIIKGKIKTSKITDHTKTNIYTVEQFLGKTFDIENNNIIKTLA